MATDFESDISSKTRSEPAQPSGWLKVGLVAAVSAVLGGMGAAWWYRKTLIHLRQVEDSATNPQFGMSDDAPSDEM